ncbi:MAG TPA: hypothetical protein VIT44_05255 [Cyclobacteriaceae bacterium]
MRNLKFNLSAYFKNFMDYGIEDVEVPEKLIETGEEFIKEEIIRNRKTLNIRLDEDIITELARDLSTLAFIIQYFSVTRLKLEPSAKPIGNIFLHAGFNITKNPNQHIDCILSAQEYLDNKRYLDKMRTYEEKLGDIVQLYSYNTPLANIHINIERLAKGRFDEENSTEANKLDIKFPMIVYRDVVRSLELVSSRFNSKCALYEFIRRRTERELGVLILMIRQPALDYLRDRDYLLESSNDKEANNREAFIIGLILVCSGHLRTRKDYETNPEMRGKSDKKYYYEYLYDKIQKVQLEQDEVEKGVNLLDENTLYEMIPDLFQDSV